MLLVKTFQILLQLSDHKVFLVLREVAKDQYLLTFITLQGE
jgi:hypothetical protein